tara:strand:+ start:234 stop:650 length:417 start_codon:yes stop_codon:yes gene_type:complete
MENFDINSLNDLLGFENEKEKFDFQKEILSLKFVKVIENFLVQNKISKKDFAKTMDYSPSYISQIFSANKFVNIDFLVKAQNALKMPFEVKLGDYNNSYMDIVYNSRHDILKSSNKGYSQYKNMDYSIKTDNEELLEG